MTDVFISYARGDRETASRLAARLEAEGWTVFWDAHLMAGEAWRQRLETEARSARCVVALWSAASVRSGYVLDEANIGLERSVLVPALLESIQPPMGFRGVQACDLTGWDGAADAPGLRELIQAISRFIGPPSALISMWPLRFVIVIGNPKVWRDLGTTINLDCRFTNPLKRRATIRRMDASAAGPGAWSSRFDWHLPYDAIGAAEHKRRVDLDVTIEVPAQGEFRTGIQFRAPRFNDRVSWPAGSYQFQLRGWADRNPDEELPDLRTEFDVSVSDDHARDVRLLLEAPQSYWEEWNPSDDAGGVQVPIGHVRTRLSGVRSLSGAS